MDIVKNNTMKSDDMIIRRFDPDDLNELKAFIDNTIEERYAPVYPKEARDFFIDYHSMESIIEDAESGFSIVIVHNGVIIATGTLAGTNIRRVFVSPEYQGLGLGRVIMEKLENRAIEQNLDKVDLSASLPAKSFYLKLGYIITLEGSSPVGNGQELKFYEMEKNFK